MIASKCFTSDWVRTQRAALGQVDPALLEKAIICFALLDHLAESGLDFVFKGGTSLLLHVPIIRRLSIDIDILYAAPPDELDRVLAGIAAKPPFLHYEEDDRGARGLPRRRHFRFVYTPIVSGNPAPSILLDVVEEARITHDLIVKDITVPFIETNGQTSVRVPTVESLLADKLCAFAPRTTGVPFEPPNGKPPDTMQIVKQLFDVGELFNLAEDLAAVKRTYERIFARENEYRGGTYRLRDVLDDTLETALHFCLHRLKGVTDHPDALMLDDGVGRIRSHLIGCRFNRDDAKTAAAKTALLTRLILAEGVDTSLSRRRTLPDAAVIRNLNIEGEWERLNRLKSLLPEAFFYWHQAQTL
ncbi:MAG: nucleotidyl transferase AbiEii/AbiGii toxin family protein [Syntrophales bacterium]|jgi:hypothetical protein|nr:nucleotidyl transferase AbiEii/AbiGii toxin family protein [Syntrophales bacterium]